MNKTTIKHVHFQFCFRVSSHVFLGRVFGEVGVVEPLSIPPVVPHGFCLVWVRFRMESCPFPQQRGCLDETLIVGVSPNLLCVKVYRYLPAILGFVVVVGM